MAVIPSRQRLRSMIEQAMKDQAPEMYRELRRSKQLGRILDLRADEAIASAEIAEANLCFPLMQKSMENINEKAALLDQAKSTAWATAISQACEFPEEPDR